jgi:hypothetical protein
VVNMMLTPSPDRVDWLNKDVVWDNKKVATIIASKYAQDVSETNESVVHSSNTAANMLSCSTGVGLGVMRQGDQGCVQWGNGADS